jgi:hypothetical protein
LRFRAARIINDLGRITGEVSNDGINLAQRDLHPSSLKQSWNCASAVTTTSREWNRNIGSAAGGRLCDYQDWMVTEIACYQ